MEQISSLQPMEDPLLEQTDVLQRKLQPVEDLYQSRHLAGAVVHRRTTLAQSVPEALYPVGRAHTGEVHEGLYPVEGTPQWSRGRA